VKTMKTLLLKTAAMAAFPVMLVLSLTLALAQRGYGQTQEQPPASTKPAGPREIAEASPVGSVQGVGESSSKSSSRSTGAADAEIPPAVARELQEMRESIEQLKAELRARKAQEQATPALVTAEFKTQRAAEAAAPATVAATSAAQTNPPEPTPPAEPFAYADWTWLNGTARNKDAVWDSKFFTPEVRFDTHFVHSFNHPRDDTLGGSTEIFRSNEIQVEQISVGGDFHWQNVRGRILTMDGMFAVTTPRNDASEGRGQWDLRGAYKYVSEAYGGYHFNVNHGLNIDAGIFVSYIGLFSYYNFDNWAYQPSYVSSNTPWFFNGLRIQWFPTDKLKIEPWIINGWQSYGRYGSKPGLGGQILYRPKPWLSLVFNNYGMGEDTLGFVPGSSPQFGLEGANGAGRSRIHTDDSIEVKYYDNKYKTLDKMAFSLTGDLGCEYGAGVTCMGHSVHNGVVWPQQSFQGWMGYNRFWFKKDLYAVTVGYGAMANPGRYLTLLPPIDGADAISGSPYFPTGPQFNSNGTITQTHFKGWDTLITFDWMPKQYITFRTEFGYRHSDQPYWTGRGGITPPGGNNGFPGQFACNNGAAAGTDPTAAVAACAGNGGVWFPDMRKDEPSTRFAIMVKF